MQKLLIVLLLSAASCFAADAPVRALKIANKLNMRFVQELDASTGRFWVFIHESDVRVRGVAVMIPSNATDKEAADCLLSAEYAAHVYEQTAEIMVDAYDETQRKLHEHPVDPNTFPKDRDDHQSE